MILPIKEINIEKYPIKVQNADTQRDEFLHQNSKPTPHFNQLFKKMEITESWSSRLN